MMISIDLSERTLDVDSSDDVDKVIEYLARSVIPGCEVAIWSIDHDPFSHTMLIKIVHTLLFAGAHVVIVTDMTSTSSSLMDLCRRVDARNVRIVADLSPASIKFDWNRFFGRVMMAARRGVNVSVRLKNDPVSLGLVDSVIEALVGTHVMVETAGQCDLSERSVMRPWIRSAVDNPNVGFDQV